MTSGIQLERVRRITGGRVHLVPRVPESGPVITLCGQTFAEATYRGSEAEADCRNCLRRQGDAGRVSSAFFQSDVGAELLQRSLERAREQRSRAAEAPPPAPAEPARPREPAATSAPEEPALGVVRRLPPPRPQRVRTELEAPSIRELRSRTPLRRTFENVYVSPEGVIVRVSDGGIAHVAFTGPVDIRQRDGVLTLRVGDMVLEFDTASVER
jgi:hypothetical protein